MVVVASFIAKNTVESDNMYDILQKRIEVSNDVIDDNFKYKRITVETVEDLT